MFEDLVKLANDKSWKVYLLGWPASQKAKNNLIKKYRSVKLFSADGPILNNEGKPISNKDIEIEYSTKKDINKIRPDILFVGFGAPKQEKWLKRNWDRLNIGGAMVLGGTFEYFAKTRKLPPHVLQNLGLEWFFRLLTGSTNLKRVINAVFVFPWAVWKSASKGDALRG